LVATALAVQADLGDGWTYFESNDADTVVQNIEILVKTNSPTPEHLHAVLYQGRDFIVWLHQDNSGYQYSFECINPGTIRDNIDLKQFVTVGFSINQSPDCLWVFQVVKKPGEGD
jgi:hypothetical protein